MTVYPRCAGPKNEPNLFFLQGVTALVGLKTKERQFQMTNPEVQL